MSVQLQSAPAVAIIDENGVLTLSFSPLPGPDPTYDGGQPGTAPPFGQYASWDIRTKHNADVPITTNKLASVLNAGETLSSRVFNNNLASGDYTLTMIAHATPSVGSPTATDSNWWQTNSVGDGTTGTRAFPATVGPSTVTFSATTLLLNQQLNVTLNPAYTAADQWRIVWPDKSDTGWLPLSAGVVTKSFSTPGSALVTVQTRYNYSGGQYNPPSTLIRQLSVQIFVMDQAAPTASTQNTGLSTVLGFGGTEGLEIIDTSANLVTPEPWEVLARGIVRDTVTNELKMIIAASRFPQASSLLGTMAIDVFPLPGRPHNIELLEPLFEKTVNANTTAVPVKIQTTSIPNLIVGKSINDALGGQLQMVVKDQTGIPNFLWTATNLPPGVSLTANGVISGVPLQIGLFNANFAVQDSGDPFSIAEITLPITVETDMLVQIKNQPVTDTDLGTATVGTPYSIAMAVGNIISTSPLPGGLAPYVWSTPAGALPAGLSIDPSSGIISGTPSTYNSSSDFFAISGKVFTVVVQVTDAIGAKASQTFTMKLAAQALTIGNGPEQQKIFATQDFKLLIPVFGGMSPYTLTSFTPAPGESGYYASSALVDGLVEVVVNVPSSAVGRHNFTIQITDAASTLVTQQVSYVVDVATAGTQLIKGWVDHYWYAGDSGSATSIPIVPNAGSFGGYVLFDDTITTFGNGIVATVEADNSRVTFAGPPTTFGNAEARVPLVLGHAEQEVGRISRVFSVMSHNAISPGTSVGTITQTARPLVIGNTIGFNPRKPYYNPSPTVPVSLATASPLPLTARVKAGSVLPLGLSLDAITGLVYGTPVAIPNPPTSIFEYVDSTGLINGTVTVNWLISREDFQVVTASVNAQVGTTYDANTSPVVILTPPSGITLNAVAAFGNVSVLPGSGTSTPTGGMSVGINVAGNAVLFGLPTEAGYFDIWLNLTATSGQQTIAYVRLAVLDPLPFSILNTTLPFIGAAAYSQQLYAFGGVPGYTWASPQFPGGSGTGNFAGLTLTTGGLITGTLSAPPGGAGITDLGTIQVTATDSRVVPTALVPAGVSLPATVSQNLDLQYTGKVIIVNNVPGTPANNALPVATGFALSSVATAVAGSAAYTFTSPQASAASNAYVGRAFTVTGFNSLGPNNGTFLVTASSTTTLTLANGAATAETASAVAGLEYAFKLTAAGGTTPYTWAVTGGSLPSGITLNASTGVLSGALTALGYAGSPVTITVTDGGSNTQAAQFIFRTPANSTGIEVLSFPTQLINSNNVGQVNIGNPYLGALLVALATQGNTANWQIAPTTSHPNALPSGLAFFTDNAPAGQFANPDNGETATFAGSYSGAPLVGYFVRVVVVDNVTGNTGSVLVDLFTGTNMAITDVSPLPNATVGIGYSYQMHVVGGVGPYTWTWNQTHPFNGLDISSSGLISGTPTITFTQPILFTVTDSLSNQATATLSLTAQPNGLVINTAGPLIATSGRAFTTTLSASGSVHTPFTWSLAPSSVALPAGLSLSSAGVLSGTTTLTGYDQNVTFRVTDSVGSIFDKVIEVKVIAGLDIQSGIDFADSLSLNILGYIDGGAVTSINPRPNDSFQVIVTGAVSQTPAGIQVTTGNPNITATVTSLNAGTAVITLSGSAFATTPGTYFLPVTVNDSGVTVTKTFSWIVYDDGILRAAPGSGSFPQQLV